MIVDELKSSILKEAFSNGFNNYSFEEREFKDVFSIINGFTPLRSDSSLWSKDEVNWFTVDDYNEQGYIINYTKQHISNKAIGKNSSRILPVGTVILCCTSATIGTSAICNIPMATNQQFNGLVANKGYAVDTKYLYYYTLTLKTKMKNDSTSTTFPFLSVKNLEKYNFPYIDINKQKEIANKIEQLFLKLDEIKPIEDELYSLKNNISNDLKYSILNYAIEGKLIKNDSSLPNSINCSYDTSPYTIPDNWSWVKISDVLDIQTGLSFKKTDQCTSSEGTVRVLRGGNINNNFQYELKDDDVYVKKISKYEELLEGDILTPSVTSMEQMGKVAYIDKKLENITAGGFVYIIRCKDASILNPKYALYFISSKFHKEMCKHNIHKSGQAFYNLKKSGLIEQPIPIPPVEEQKRIVNKIEELLPLLIDVDNIVNS